MENPSAPTHSTSSDSAPQSTPSISELLNLFEVPKVRSLLKTTLKGQQAEEKRKLRKVVVYLGDYATKPYITLEKIQDSIQQHFESIVSSLETTTDKSFKVTGNRLNRENRCAELTVHTKVDLEDPQRFWGQPLAIQLDADPAKTTRLLLPMTVQGGPFQILQYRQAEHVSEQAFLKCAKESCGQEALIVNFVKTTRIFKDERTGNEELRTDGLLVWSYPSPNLRERTESQSPIPAALLKLDVWKKLADQTPEKSREYMNLVPRLASSKRHSCKNCGWNTHTEQQCSLKAENLQIATQALAAIRTAAKQRHTARISAREAQKQLQQRRTQRQEQPNATQAPAAPRPPATYAAAVRSTPAVQQQLPSATDQLEKRPRKTSPSPPRGGVKNSGFNGNYNPKDRQLKYRAKNLDLNAQKEQEGEKQVKTHQPDNQIQSNSPHSTPNSSKQPKSHVRTEPNEEMGEEIENPSLKTPQRPLISDYTQKMLGNKIEIEEMMNELDGNTAEDRENKAKLVETSEHTLNARTRDASHRVPSTEN